MIRIVAIGDPHLRDDAFPASKKLVTSLLNKVSTLSPDGIVVLGDTLHTHSNVKIASLTLAKRLFKGMRDIAPLIVLIGNHDITHNKIYLPESLEPEHPFIFLHEWENVTVCDRAAIFTIKGYSFCGVPYVPPGRYNEAIQNIPAVEMTAFFSHQQFRGVKTRLSEPGLDGDVWPSSYPLNICGHFHEAQSIGDNIEYVGTPQQQDSGESDNKAIGVFTFSREYIERAKKINNVYVVYDREPLQGTTHRKTFKIDSTDISALKEAVAFSEEKKDEYIVKIEVTGTSNELATLRKNVTYRKIAECSNITVTPIVGTEAIIPSRLTFLDQIYAKLEDDPEAKGFFVKLFS